MLQTKERNFALVNEIFNKIDDASSIESGFEVDFFSSN